MIFNHHQFDNAKIQCFILFEFSQKPSMFSQFAQKFSVTMKSFRIFAP